MRHRCETWPRVLPNDDGIRPAGERDRCFYCHSKVGEEHGRECVCVSKVVRYRVYMNLDRPARYNDKGRPVGTFTRDDPHFWTAYDCEFHKNDSSWCADNALDGIEWIDPADAERLEAWLREKDSCACGPLSFEYDETVDEGPFVELRESPAERPSEADQEG